jgi:hypothetical protein
MKKSELLRQFKNSTTLNKEGKIIFDSVNSLSELRSEVIETINKYECLKEQSKKGLPVLHYLGKKWINGLNFKFEAECYLLTCYSICKKFGYHVTEKNGFYYLSSKKSN